MRRHLETVLAHAERKFAATRDKRPEEILAVYKKFLKIEEHRLRLRHQAGAGGREICARRAELVDMLLRHLFVATTTGERKEERSGRIAVMALGGYGRSELNPFSDVDIMFVHGESVRTRSAAIDQIVEQILYFLWDIGFKVGHSTRSISEAVAIANEDMLTKTAMLESRLVVGDVALGAEFRRSFRAKCVTKHEREFVEMRMRDQAARHAKFGNSVYMQEPHLKSGCGGLRDYQNLLWMTFFQSGELTTTHLVGKDWLTEPDQRRIDSAYDFLLRLRTDLHYLTGRATDTLHLNLQEEVARRLNYELRRGLVRSEALMRDVYAHCRNIFRVTERITEQFANDYASGKTRSLFAFIPRRREEEQRLGDFVIRGGQLDLLRHDLFEQEPEQMMRAFQLLQQHGVDLSADLADVFDRRPGLVTRTFQYAKQPREVFLRILSRKGEVGRVLRAMHRVDFLGRYIPEFGPLTCLVQHEFFHRYTADEHTLVCIEKLDALSQTADSKLANYRRLFERLDDPLVLYLALLLHDTGKGVGARPHSEASALFAQRVARRLQLSAAQRRSLILLVDHHVTLSMMAQQRNIDDPATVAEFAAIVQRQSDLDALMLLTLADGQGTTAEGWSDWKETLVWHLYRATSQYLSDRASYNQQIIVARESLQRAVAADLPPDFSDEIDAHFESMPDNYFRAFSVREIMAHVGLIRRFLQNLYRDDISPLAPAIEWTGSEREGHSTVSICTWERDQLLAKIAGSFAVVPLNILSADIYTRRDHIVLDVFRVADAQYRALPHARDIQLVEKTLHSSLEDSPFVFQPLLAAARSKLRRTVTNGIEFPTRITFDNRAHPAYTLIGVETPDRIGLLYDVVSSLSACGVSIATSRISTEKGAAIDTFYVSDTSTRAKLTDANRMRQVHEQLHSAVGLPPGIPI